MAGNGRIAILGIFAADTTYRAARLPKMGETLLGRSFALGPGGKGSNQAIAAAKLGAEVHFITRLGDDAFAELAIKTWTRAGVTPVVQRDPSSHTGAAFIFVEDGTGDNAIIVTPGAAAAMGPADADAHRDTIAAASVFMTQLEQPLPAARRGLEIARAAGVVTILNPAPAAPLDDALLALCDYITPNESEASALSGIEVASVDDARRAADVLMVRGVGAVVVTLGHRGALLHGRDMSTLVPACNAGEVVETTGAGDAFNGGFAAALARGIPPIEAVAYGCAVAGLSVTRAGAAASMPTRAEVEALLASA